MSVQRQGATNLRELRRLFGREASGEVAYNKLLEIVRHHRIQASPGYREAVERLCDLARRDGLEAEVLRYKAEPGVTYLGNPVPEEWECTGAELWLLEEARRVAWWEAAELSVFQRSAPTPPEGIETEVVLVREPENEESYQGLDLSGKMVLIGNEDLGRVRELAVERHGACGIVTDRMTPREPVRQPGDLADSLQYTSFWWSGNEKRCFGFVVTPREGARLRQLLDSKPAIRVKAKVDARFYPGAIENLSIYFPAKLEDEEILVVAHLCHPRPSANDNASGAAAALEAARILGRLIKEGRLPAPKRSIRFLLVPEMTGTYAFLATNSQKGKGKIRAALNLDMVGEDQAQCRSVLLAEHPPLAAGSFVGHLLERVMETVADDVRNLAGSGSYGLFARAVSPFSGGSDHYILSDPTVGIPCPMLIQWPDRFYHTSADTPDRVDPWMLKRAAVIAATYAYFLANMGRGEAEWLLAEMASDFPARLRSFLGGRDGGGENPGPRQKAEFYERREVEKLRALSSWLPEEDRAAFATALRNAEESVREALQRELFWWKGGLAASVGGVGQAERDGETLPGDLRLVPRRLQPGPTPLHLHLVRLSQRERDEWWALTKGRQDAHYFLTQLEYWADGQRTIGEILELVELETGCRDDELAVAFFRLLARLERVEFA